MRLIEDNFSCLNLVATSNSAYSGSKSVINALTEHLSEPTPTGRRCEMYAE
jgi:hypothetical protein